MNKVRHSTILNLDGKTLEGGGQLLRLALSLSCLTGRGIRVTDIRGNRTRGRGKRATKGGGLKSSHYECTQWLARASNAHVEGLYVGSSELLFQPRLGLAKDGFDFDAMLDETLAAGQGEEEKRDGVDTADAQGNSRRKYETRAAAAPRRLTITQKTPGAVYLIVQALLPYLLFGPCCLPRMGKEGGEPDGRDGQDAPAAAPAAAAAAAAAAVPTPDVVLRVFGGTNVSSSPSHEYTTQVLLPTLTDHVGLPPVRSTLLRRGWSTPASTPGGTASAFDLGEVELTLTPSEPGRPLPAFTMTDDRRGDLHSFDVSVIANPPSLLQELELRIHSDLNDRFPGVTVQTVVREDSGRTNRVYVLVVAKVNTAGQNGDGDSDGDGNGKLYRLGRDILFDGREKGGGRALAAQIAKAVVRDISSEVAHGGCVDEHLHDQLVVFQALAQGTSRVTRGTSSPSLHTQTARWVAEQILDGLEFKSNGKCKGFGFVPGSGLGIET